MKIFLGNKPVKFGVGGRFYSPYLTEATAQFATAAQMMNVVLSKTADAGGAVTAHPGGRTTYNISITNNNSSSINVRVEDILPAGMAFVSGCDDVVGNKLSWVEHNIVPGATRVISYRAKPDYTIDQVRNSEADIIINNTVATVQNVSVPTSTEDIYVLETFNNTDRRRMEMAINSLITANLTAKESNKKLFSGATLAHFMYYVGFSAGISLSTDLGAVLTSIFDGSSTWLNRIAPKLYGGSKVASSKDSLFRGARATDVHINDLISGDLLIVDEGGSVKLYIVNANTLVYLGVNEVIAHISPDTILPGLVNADRYVVIRPSIDYNVTYSLQDDEYFNEADISGYSDMEKALISTAEAYLLRGDRCQYTDDMTGKAINRAESGYKNPEDYTVDQYGYTNCANFTYDVHVMTHGYKAKGTQTDGTSKPLNTTTYNNSYAKKYWNMETGTSASKGVVFYSEPSSMTFTEESKAALKQQIISLLHPGDIITISRTDGTGHAMLYAGRGMIIHSSGSSYSTANDLDTHEASIRFRMVEDLFEPTIYNEKSCVYNLKSFSIIRLQNLTSYGISENALNRINNMQGIIGEKISSTAMGKTVNPGDDITYTFYVFNTNPESRQITIKDIISEYVDFVSATDLGTNVGNEVNWSFTAPANTRMSVSYTVKVKDGVATYTEIDGTKATINGVMHKCINSYVANTLTTDQQQDLMAAVNEVKSSGSSTNAIQNINKIYETAFGVTNIFGDSVTTEAKLIGNITQTSGMNNVGIFNDTTYYSSAGFVIMSDANTSKPAMMVAPGLFGGSHVYNSSKSGETFTRYKTSAGGVLRSRLYWEKDLVIGDILLTRGATTTYLHMYIGNDTFVRMSDFATTSVATRFQYAQDQTTWRYHAVLRPSMVLDI